MAVNLTKVLSQIETRHAAIDSNTDATEHTRLDAINDRINAMGGVLTYRSTGHLPTITDSAYIGTIAYVAADNVFGDSSGAFYMATFRDSGWVKVPSLQDSDEGAIAAPGGGGAAEPSNRQGSNYGFFAGGMMPAIAGSWNYIQKFPLTSDANTSDIGDLTDYTRQNQGASSSTHGYGMGGFVAYGPNNPSVINVIEKWSMLSDGNAADAGDLVGLNRLGAGLMSPTDGYYAGGYPPASPTGTNLIQKFPFASDGNTADTGQDLLLTTYSNTSCMSSTHGYVMGGYPSPNPTGDYSDQIQKFPYASGSNATDVGNLIAGNSYGGGNQSNTHGYHAGGNGAGSGGFRNDIQKFTFASDADATDVGDLTTARYQGTGNAVTSTTHGYAGGGAASPYVNTIDKFSLSSDGNATDVGDMLSPAAQYASSHN